MVYRGYGKLIRTRRKYKRIWRADIDKVEKWYAFDFNCRTHQVIWNAEMNYLKVEFARNKCNIKETFRIANEHFT